MRLLCPPNPSLIRLLLIFLAFSVNPRFCVKIPVDQQFLFKVTSQISLPILTPALNFCRLSWTCPRPAQQHSLLYERDWSHSTRAFGWKPPCGTFSCTRYTPARVTSCSSPASKMDRQVDEWMIYSFLWKFLSGTLKEERRTILAHCSSLLSAIRR